MKFIINKIILWFPDGDKKVLEFKPNKINIITGESNTGKSAILQIIDYVFFASHSKISESIINENVAWYGLQFSIQDKQFTIARSALYQGKATYDYYFSSIGNIPKIPSKNNEESSIKVLIEAEFGIDRNIKIPFGGKVIKAGSKVSLRYFLLFSTISEDIITSSEVYFDKQNESRYREALPRIFDLAVGIDDVENIVKKERLQSLKGQLRSLTRKQNIKSSKKTDFLSELDKIIKKSKSYGLIPESLDSESSIVELAEIVTSFKTKSSTDSSSKYDLLKKEEYKIGRIIRNLSSLSKEYQVYKSSLNGVIDSLKPVQYLEDNNKDLVRTSIFDEILSSLKADLASIKADTKRTVPIDTNVSDLIHEQEQKLNSVKTQLANLPQSATSFESDREKHFFLGELKAKLDLYTSRTSLSDIDYQKEIEDLENEIEGVKLTDITDKRSMFIKLFEQIVQEYITFAGNVLANYANYNPVFNYTEKKLTLRKPLTDYIESVGSSSNHMFMHLFFFLGLHEAIQRKESRFVPSFLVIDQPSRPYWGDGEKKKEKLDTSDEAKITKAFELMNFFAERMLKDVKKEFQIIVLEHVPPTIWEGLNHTHLVDIFALDNALIPKKYTKGE